MKPLIALDLDDLIYPFIGAIVPRFNDELGTDASVEQFFTYDFEEVLGTTRQRVIEIVLDYFVEAEKQRPSPLEGSLDAVAALSERYRLVVVSAREDSLREFTVSWLNMHFPERFEEVHLCNSYVLDDRPTKRRKVDVCLELGALALVDDSLSNVTEAASRGMRGILYGEFPWNRADVLPEGVVRVTSWNEVVDELMDASWV